MKNRVMLATILAGVLLGACRNPAAERTVILEVLGYGTDSDAAGAMSNRQIDQFMDQYLDVQLVSELYDDEACHHRVAQRLASGEVPHVAYMGADVR